MNAPTKTDAETAIGEFLTEFKAKYPKATACRGMAIDATVSGNRRHRDSVSRVVYSQPSNKNAEDGTCAHRLQSSA